MWLSIFHFELRYWLRNPSFYFYLAILFVLAVIMMSTSAGLFGAASTDRVANSAFSLYSFVILFNKLILFIVPSIIGGSIYRDFKSRSFQVMYTFPFTKWDYLGAKFLSSLAVVLFLSGFTVFGLFLGTKFPGTNPSLLVEFNWLDYLQVFGVYLVPNLIVFGSLVFAIVTLTRNVYAGFITVVVMLIIRELVSRILGDGGGVLAHLAEPLGDTATLFETKNWSQVDQNQNSLPFNLLILLNRALWLSVAILVFILTYRKFSFSQLGWKFTFGNHKPERSTKNNFGSLIKLNLSPIRFNFNWLHQLRLVWRLSQVDFLFIVRSGSFFSIALVGIILVVVLLSQMNPMYETRILPVTWVMLAFPLFFFTLLVNFLTFLYAGILIQRGRNTRMNELLDICPINEGALVFSKWLALVKMQVVLLAVIFGACVGVQAYNGYFQFEIRHYLFDLFGIHLIGFAIWAIAAVFIHSVLLNSYLGLFILIMGYFGASQLQLIGLESLVFQFNQDLEPGFFIRYSDMSGHGHALAPYFILKGYWMLVGLLLFLGSILAWSRGTSQTLRSRLFDARARLGRKLTLMLLIVILLVVAAGFTIFQLEKRGRRVPNDAQLSNTEKQADSKYGHFRNFIQPRITDVTLALHLYPEKRAFTSTGKFILVNKSTSFIDTLLINYSPEAFTHYEFDEAFEVLQKDSIAKFDICRLMQPLAPGDSLHMHFEVQSIPNSWLYQNSAVLENGTFITSLIYPGLGYYSTGAEGDATDTLARRNHYRSIDSDYISLNATVSTSADQLAIAPGYLTKRWSEDGRNFFQYQSKGKVTNDYAFTSGRYQVITDTYKDINLEIYYHPSHNYNLTHFMNGLKSTLAYCEAHFGPYQHEQVRIIEYSRKVGDFAQSFANTIPMSERSFIMDIDESNSEALNLSFLGASHELAHQWWGHQVIPADVEGSRMITESLAEYVSLCMLEQAYGQEKGMLFRKKALDIYLKKRVEDEDEKSLMRNSGLDKPYIPYQKGSMAFYALRDFLGEEHLNHALRTYLERVKFQEAPYTTSSELVAHLRHAVPDTLTYLIHDLFENVILYNNKLDQFSTVRLENGNYEVSIEFSVTKFQDQGGIKVYTDKGGQTLTHQEGGEELRSLPLRDYVEIGIFSQTGENLYLKKHLVTQIKNKVSIVVDQKPEKVALDPLVKLLDINGD